MKKNLFLLAILLFSIFTYSQTENATPTKSSKNITTQPLKAFIYNGLNIETLSVKHASYLISKKHKRFFKRLKKKQKSIKTLHKIIASIFGRSTIVEPYKLKHRLKFSSLKRKKSQNGFHLIEGLYDAPTSNTNNLYKAPFMVSIKALYGYLLETKNTLMTSYPGIGILPYRVPKKQTFAGNALKDLIVGFKLDIDFKL